MILVDDSCLKRRLIPTKSGWIQTLLDQHGLKVQMCWEVGDTVKVFADNVPYADDYAALSDSYSTHGPDNRHFFAARRVVVDGTNSDSQKDEVADNWAD